MVVHRAPQLSWEIVEKNWRKSANIESATWITTYFNVEEGVRYCLWNAPDKAALEKIFGNLEISFESIAEVEETKPHKWGKKWVTCLEADATAETLGV